jgi:PAS domain S-box-containing protein
MVKSRLKLRPAREVHLFSRYPSLLKLKSANSVRFSNSYSEIEILQEKYSSIFENSIEGIFQITPSGTFTIANQSMAKIFNFNSPEDLIASTDNITEKLCVTPADIGILKKALLKNGRIKDYEMQLYKKDSTKFWGSISARSVYDDKARLIYFEGRLIDISARKAKEQAEREKQIAIETSKTMKELEKKKTDFLSSVSHELRTPLTSILGFAKLVHKDIKKFLLPMARTEPKAFKKAQRAGDNLAIIITEGERLTRMINDVLDIAKIESGKIMWRDEVFPVKEFIEQAVQAASGALTLKPELQLKISITTGEIKIDADKDRLIQVLVNILNNAVKFTDKGTISIKAEKQADGNFIQVSIKDTGIGIPAEDIDKIFDKFHQAIKGDTLEDKPKGTGLGLAICKQMIEHYGGKIWAESEPDQGSTFIFTLPIIEN